MKKRKTAIERIKNMSMDALRAASIVAGGSEKPECFTPNGYAYPLCNGNGSEKCSHCNLCENMIEGGD